MGGENSQLVRRFIDAFVERDPRVVVELADPGIEFHPVTVQLDGSRPYVGLEGLWHYAEDVARSWEEFRLTAHEFREDGQTVVALGRVYARGGGRVIDSPIGWVWTVRGGRVCAGHAFLSRREALEYAGLADKA